ncbi:MAG: capsule assembly Wzi family protein, partial [Nitrospirota bacterium]
AGLASRADLGRVSFYFNPELRYSEDDEDFVVKRAYSVLSFWGLELEAGKDSQWWGPGRHGALLLSNNAEPLTMLKLTNPHPVLLPWVFERLGPFRFVFFVSRLEEERAVAEPYIWGLRLNFKPSPYVELGLARTAMLGGEGHSESPGTWARSFLFLDRGSGDVSDHKVSFDLKITLPLRRLPAQVYGEVAVEDGGLPSAVADIVGYDGDSPMTAYLAGLYLPGPLGVDRAALTVEYATTRADNRPKDRWYTHHVYQSGHTFKGRVLGHHMGAEAEDLFVEVSYLLPELNGGVKVSYDRESRDLPGGGEQEKSEFSATLSLEVIKDLALDVRVAGGALEGYADDAASLFALTASYRY